eukprot:2460672-Rhodomonas_salina.1
MFSQSTASLGVANAKAAIAQIVVGSDSPQVMELSSSSFSLSTQTAAASFFTFPNPTAGDVLGL